jgi:hypothetical protein
VNGRDYLVWWLIGGVAVIIGCLLMLAPGSH